MKNCLVLLIVLLIVGCTSPVPLINNFEGEKTLRANGGDALKSRVLLSISGGLVVDGDRFSGFEQINLSLPRNEEVITFAKMPNSRRIAVSFKYADSILKVSTDDVEATVKIEGKLSDGVLFRSFDVGDGQKLIFRNATFYLRTDG